MIRAVAEYDDGERDVAIVKIATDAAGIARLTDHIWPLVALRRPHLVELIDIARTADDGYVAVTEYVAGRSLSQLGMLPHDIVRIVSECCAALVQPHRCISPRTIIVDRSGRAALRELGFAQTRVEAEQFGYLSPEAANGERTDGRADVFALGVILWEHLAGRRLFLADSDYATLECVREAHVPALADPTLDRVVRQALAVDRRVRFASVAELAAALGPPPPSTISVEPAPIDAWRAGEAQRDIAQLTSLLV